MLQQTVLSENQDFKQQLRLAKHHAEFKRPTEKSERREGNDIVFV